MSSYRKTINIKYAALVKKEMKKKEKNRWKLIQDSEYTYTILPPKALNASNTHKFQRDSYIKSTFNFYFKCFGMTETHIFETKKELLTRVKREFIEIVKEKI